MTNTRGAASAAPARTVVIHPVVRAELVDQINGYARRSGMTFSEVVEYLFELALMWPGVALPEGASERDQEIAALRLEVQHLQERIKRLFTENTMMKAGYRPEGASERD